MLEIHLAGSMTYAVDAAPEDADERALLPDADADLTAVIRIPGAQSELGAGRLPSLKRVVPAANSG